MLKYLLLSLLISSSFTLGTRFSPYKYTLIDLNLVNYKLQSGVLGNNQQPLVDTLPSDLDEIVLAFASGECGSEMWGSVPGDQFATANIGDLVKAQKKYVISTGGQGSTFTCGTKEGFEAFVNRYKSDYLVGIDFDIEFNQDNATIQNLVTRAKEAETTFPNLIFSFTVQTISGAGAADVLESVGLTAVQSIASSGLSKFYINLMAMEYGPGQCITNSNNTCDMGQSAISAIKMLNQKHNLPMKNIGVTLMIGANSSPGQVVSLDDAKTVAQFAVDNKLEALHIWSFDRDVDTPAGSEVTAQGNSYGSAGTLGFTKLLIQAVPKSSNESSKTEFSWTFFIFSLSVFCYLAI